MIYLGNQQGKEEDKAHKAQQVEQAIANKRRINRDLEMKSGMFSVYQEFILKNIKKAHDGFRRITAGELMFTVQDFLNTRYPGSTVKRTGAADTAVVRLSPVAADALTHYIMHADRQSQTALCSARQNTLCCFGNRGESNAESGLYREIVDINHPLIKWIVNAIRAENASSSSCFAIQISRKHLPGALAVAPGIYSFYIQQWIADGARKLNELHYFLNGVNDAAPVNPALAENLLTIAALQGDSFDTVFLDDADFELAVDAVNRLINHAWSEFGEFEILHREQNDDGSVA